MKNQKGITLIELLAALAIMGIIVTLVSSVLFTGTSSSDRIKTNQQLQQEANLIVEKVRSNYLKNTSSSATSEEPAEVCTGIQKIKLEVKNDGLWMDDEKISEGYIYSEVTSELCRTKSSEFKAVLEKDNLEYTIETSFSKLN